MAQCWCSADYTKVKCDTTPKREHFVLFDIGETETVSVAFVNGAEFTESVCTIRFVLSGWEENRTCAFLSGGKFIPKNNVDSERCLILFLKRRNSCGTRRNRVSYCGFSWMGGECRSAGGGTRARNDSPCGRYVVNRKWSRRVALKCEMYAVLGMFPGSIRA